MARADQDAPPKWVRWLWEVDALGAEAGQGAGKGLDIGRIVRAGIALADDEGLEGVSVRKLAQRLGVSTMAAYRHIGSRDEVVAAMVDVAFGQPPLLPGAPEGWEAGLWQGLRFLWLPALALACVQGAILARFVRTSMLEVQGEPFVRTARAKGLSMRQVLWGHVFRNASIPVLTVAGMQFAELLGGAVVIENVFSLPGLGRLLFQSIANRDLPVVRNGVLLLVAMVVVINFLVDVLAAWIDPRLRVRVR